MWHAGDMQTAADHVEQTQFLSGDQKLSVGRQARLHVSCEVGLHRTGAKMRTRRKVMGTVRAVFGENSSITGQDPSVRFQVQPVTS